MSVWSSGLFDCCNDVGICVYGCIFPSCLFGENAQKIDQSSCFGSCFTWYLLLPCCLCGLVHMGKREHLRRTYGLQEDCNDCVAATFCATCAICQDARELKARGGLSGGTTTVTIQPMGGNVYPSLGQPGMMHQGQY